MVSERRSDPASSVPPDTQLSKALKRLGAAKEKDPTYHEVLQNCRAASAAIREQFHGATLKASSGYMAQQALRNEVLKDQRKLLFASSSNPSDSACAYTSSASELSLEPPRTPSDASAPPRRHRRSTSGAIERTSQQLGVYQVDLSLMQRAADAAPSRKPASTSALQPTSTQPLASPNRMNLNFIFNDPQLSTSSSSPPTPLPQGSCTAPAPTLYRRSHDLGSSSSALRSSLAMASRPSSSRPLSTALLTAAGASQSRLSAEFSSSSSLCSPSGSAPADSPRDPNPGPKPRPGKSNSSCTSATIRMAAEQSKRPDLLLHQLLTGNHSNQGNSGRSSPVSSPKTAERRTPDADACLRSSPSISAGQLCGRLSQLHLAAAPAPAKPRLHLLLATRSSPSLQLQP